MESEGKVLDRIRMTLQRGMSRFFRNNVGIAKYRTEGGSIQTVTYGLCKGSSDLIGWHTIEVTEAMVGGRIAVFAAVELKRGRDVLTQEQFNFIRAVSEAGGIAGFVNGEEAAAIMVDEISAIIQAGGLSGLRRDGSSMH